MKPLCSLCKVVLLDEKNGQMECPNCHAIYYQDKEIIEYQDDDFTSSHSEEYPELGGIDSSPGIMTATDEDDAPLTDQLYRHWKHAPNRGENERKKRERQKELEDIKDDEVKREIAKGHTLLSYSEYQPQ